MKKKKKIRLIKVKSISFRFTIQNLLIIEKKKKKMINRLTWSTVGRHLEILLGVSNFPVTRMPYRKVSKIFENFFGKFNAERILKQTTRRIFFIFIPPVFLPDRFVKFESCAFCLRRRSQSA